MNNGYEGRMTMTARNLDGLTMDQIKGMSKEQINKLERRIAGSIRFSMNFIMTKITDLSACPSYSIADEAWDMLGYVSEEANEVRELIKAAKLIGLFGMWSDSENELLEDIDFIMNLREDGNADNTV